MSMEFDGDIKMKKDNNKVQIYSKVKINDFWIDQGGEVKAQ